MNTAAILGILVRLEGANEVVRKLQGVEDQVDKTARAVSRVQQAVAASATASGIAIGVAAVKSYENLEKVRRSFAALVGETQGTQLKQWLVKFGEDANAPTDALMKATERWISAGGELAKARPLAQGLERFFGIGKTAEELDSVARAISQIRNRGTFGGQEREQLANAGVNLDAVAKKLGVKNIQQALGMESTKVVDALIASLLDIPRKPALLMQRFNNILERLNNSLALTGERLSNLGNKLASLAEMAVGFLAWMNSVTSGWAGFLIVVGLAVGGLKLLIQATFGTAGAMRGLAGAAVQASIALRGIGAGGVGGAGGGIVPIGSPGFIGPKQSKWFEAGKWVGNLVAKLKPLVSWLGTITATAAAFAATLAASLAVVERLANIIQPGAVKPENSVFNPDMWKRRWAENFGGGPAAEKPSPTDQNAQRPIRRSSWENLIDRRHGYTKFV